MLKTEQLAQDRSLLQYAVGDDESVWAQRAEEAAKYLESHAELPRERLSQALVDKKIVRTDDRLEYLRRAAKSKHREFLLTNGRPSKFTRTGVPIEQGHVAIRGTLTDPPPLWEIRVKFAGLPWEQREPAFAALGDLLAAFCGHTAPGPAANMLAAHSMVASTQNMYSQAIWYQQALPLLTLLDEQQIQLPTLATLRSDGVRAAPWQPDQLGWINYWSVRTCEYLGFPQAGRDDDLLRWSTRTPAGAWIVKITPEPLDVTIVEHVRMLASVYARLPRLGIRMTL